MLESKNAINKALHLDFGIFDVPSRHHVYSSHGDPHPCESVSMKSACCLQAMVSEYPGPLSQARRVDEYYSWQTQKEPIMNVG